MTVLEKTLTGRFSKLNLSQRKDAERFLKAVRKQQNRSQLNALRAIRRQSAVSKNWKRNYQARSTIQRPREPNLDGA